MVIWSIVKYLGLSIILYANVLFNYHLDIFKEVLLLHILRIKKTYRYIQDIFSEEIV